MVKYLIIPENSLSGILYSTPIARCLKSQIEEQPVEIHYFIDEIYQSVLSGNKNADQIHIYQKDEKDQIQNLDEQLFDYIIDFRNDRIAKKIRKKLRLISFELKESFWNKLKILISNKLPENPLHQIEKYFQALSIFDLKNDQNGLDFPISYKDEVNLLSLPDEFPYGYIAFCIGSLYATQRLPEDKIIQLCQKIDTNILLLGTEAEQEQARLIIQNVGRKAYSLCGNLTYNQLASVIRQSKLVLSYDNDLLAIASAWRKKIISIWGSSMPEMGRAPWEADKMSVVAQIKKLPCRPCSLRGGLAKCPQKHFACMQNIDIEKIAQIVNWYILPTYQPDVVACN